MVEPPVPDLVREGIRSGILSALARDFELAGARTARRLLAAGAIGVAGSVGVTLLVAAHPFGHHPTWHVAFFSALWAGLLVVALSFLLLGVRTPTLLLGQAASVALLGLGIAGVCGALCPDGHFLGWWGATPAGAWARSLGGPAASALCLGFAATFGFGLAAALLAAHSRGERASGPFLPALSLFLLLVPGVALQSVGASLAVFGTWTLGTALGSYAGVSLGQAARAALIGQARA